MRCEKALEAIAEAWGASGPLPGRVRRHVERCGHCRRERDLVERLLRETARIEVPDPGEEYWRSLAPRIRRRIAALPARRPGAAGDTAVAAPRRPITVTLAAAAMILVAALSWIARPGGLRPGGAETEIARLQARLEERMGRARAEEWLLLEDGVVPGIGPDISGSEPLFDPAEIGRLAGEAAALLSRDTATGLPDFDEMLEGLTSEELRGLIEDLGPAGPTPTGGASKGVAG